jgi:hypothetical protein
MVAVRTAVPSAVRADKVMFPLSMIAIRPVAIPITSSVTRSAIAVVHHDFSSVIFRDMIMGLNYYFFLFLRCGLDSRNLFGSFPALTRRLVIILSLVRRADFGRATLRFFLATFFLIGIIMGLND